MHYFMSAFWICVAVTLCLAMRDCMAKPEEAYAAWKRFRPVGAVVVAIAVCFLVVNLVRPTGSEIRQALVHAFRLAGIAVLAAVFYSGGRRWATALQTDDETPPKAGYSRLRGRYRPHLEIIILSLVAVGLSLAAFGIVEPVPAPDFRKWLNSDSAWRVQSGYFALSVLLAPLWEEAAFRFYLLNRIEGFLAGRNWGRGLAILVSTTFWACGHVMISDPIWVKFAQIFAIGFLLAWRFRAIGLTGCVIVHLSVNVTALALQP